MLEEVHKDKPKKYRTLKRLIPFLDWAPKYNRKWLIADIIAGLSVWAIMVPEALGYASIAGVPIIYGLYAAMAALLIYGFLGTSKKMITGPSTVVAAITGAVVLSVFPANSIEAVLFAASIALVAGILFLVLGLLKLGWISKFMAGSVITGFIFGIAIEITVRQIPDLLGITVHGTNTWTDILLILVNLQFTHIPTLIIGLSALVIMILLKRFLPKLPGVLIALIFGIVISGFFFLESLGVHLIGEVPQGLPPIRFPIIPFLIDPYLQRLIPVLIMGALAVFLVGYAESYSVARKYAVKYHEQIDNNQEFIALGGSNLGASLVLGFGVSGGLSKSAINDDAGGKTQLVSIIAGIMIILTLLFFAPIFELLPSAVLAAIVIFAVSHLFEVHEMKRLYRVYRPEFWLALLTLLSVITFGSLIGIAVGVVFSIILFVARASRAPIPELGKDPRREDYRDITTHPNFETIPGLIMLRFDRSLNFMSSESLRERYQQIVESARDPIKMIIVDMEGVNFIDIQGADTLLIIAEELESKGIEFHLVSVRSRVYSLLEKDGLIEKIGTNHIHAIMTEATNYYKQKFLRKRIQ